MKSHTEFRMVGLSKLETLNGIKRRNDRRRALSLR